MTRITSKIDPDVAAAAAAFAERMRERDRHRARRERAALDRVLLRERKATRSRDRLRPVVSHGRVS